MYFPWDLCFCFGLKVITWHSDQIGDFFLPDAWRQRKEFVSGATCEVMKNRSELETVPGRRTGPNKLDRGLSCSWNLGAKRRKGSWNRKRRNERKRNWAMKIQDYVMDEDASFHHPWGTISCCYRRSSLGTSLLSLDTYALCCSSGPWAARASVKVLGGGSWLVSGHQHLA